MCSDKSKIFQLYVEAYNEATIQKLIKIFQGQLYGLSEDNIRFYVKRFDQIKMSPKLLTIAAKYPRIKNPLDIFHYTWHQLEAVVDQFPIKSKEQVKMHADNADLIYNQNGLEIYRADTKEKCIYYGQQYFGRQYSFCISRPRDGNLYDEYRLEGRTFYFVRDNDEKVNNFGNTGDTTMNGMHLLVIHATIDPDEFHVTNAHNSGDKEMRWNDIEDTFPKLRGLRELFKFVPFSDEENKQIKTRTWTPSAFEYNMVESNQKEYIETDYLLLPMSIWETLSEDWRLTYVKTRRDLAKMFSRETGNRTQRLKAYDAFKRLDAYDVHWANFAYKLTAKIAHEEIGKQSDWIYATNALINITGDISNRIPKAGGGYVDEIIHGVDMISINPKLCEYRMMYYPAKNLIVDDATGNEWVIKDEKIIQTK